MDIVLNEKEYAEKILAEKSVDNKPFFTLTILAKYYYHCFGYRKKKITELLVDYMQKYYPRYYCNRAMWDENIEKIAKNVSKYTFYEISGVWITEAELVTIESINNKVLERLAFTLLCLAKLGALKNPNNNGWVNLEAKEIYRLARISCSVIDRYKKLGQLKELSLLEFPQKNDNLSCRVTFINNDSEQKLFISDFRELGYEYLQYKGEEFIRCGECGILMRNNKAGNKKYCSQCSGYTPKNYKTIVCVDCGKELEVSAKNNNSCRCEDCYTIYRRKYKSKKELERYHKNKIWTEQLKDKIIL